ncbi:MinD/ParA family protein [Paenibacillus aurantius]|uniref:MinD/ParA family protein n=1 Tax=Paenibacillus aurantius TaxID=2918900 RepID=A0AA96RHP1_9BACL|nr:MinD/ParA family protein [Paenibacillus aurantius]WNQ13751.1 MinD/ParA family protein [Paenibacillus aurantius]
MSDQAQSLRNLILTRQASSVKNTRVITVTSGKGGVGKSNFTLNFALTLQKRGYQVLIFDADIGLANIDVLMGVASPYSLYHLLKKEKNIWDIIQTGPHGLRFIAGGSGFTDLLRLKDSELDYFSDQISQLNGHVDFILFDTGAGLSKETLKFILAAHETFVVTTPEPTSITDAYAIIKMVHSEEKNVPFRLVINRVSDDREGLQTADKIRLVAKRFLQLDIPILGYVADDSSVTKAVKKQTPFTVAFPGSPAARSLEELVDHFIKGQQMEPVHTGGVKGFLHRMIRLLK